VIYEASRLGKINRAGEAHRTTDRAEFVEVLPRHVLRTERSQQAAG
jgi:hypothetical protein